MMWKIDRIHVLLLVWYMSLSLSINAQDESSILSLRRKELLRKISRAELMNSDLSGYLDKDFFKEEDSIKTKFWKNYYWFFFNSPRSKQGKNIDCHNLFALDLHKKKLIKVLDRCFEWIDETDFYQKLHFYNDKLYICGGFSSKYEMGEIGILVVDEVNMKQQTYLTVRGNAWFEEEYIKDQQLHIVVQPMKRELNLWYYLTFWMPRGRGDKWEYEKDGNKWLYAFDTEFKLISKRELKD